MNLASPVNFSLSRLLLLCFYVSITLNYLIHAVIEIGTVEYR